MQEPIAFIYVHKTTKRIEVLDMEQTRVFNDCGWRHVATINTLDWIKHLLNLPARKRGQAIRNTLEQP